jgi:transcriptional regulator with XRE-family HTH domain
MRNVHLRLSPDAFGLALRGARARAHLTQKDLARASQVGVTRISEIEQGKVNPTLRTIDALALGLDMKTSELLVEVERVAATLQRQ